MIEQSRLLDKR